MIGQRRRAGMREQREGVGLRFSAAVEAVLQQIERNPYQFPLLEKNVRRALLQRFPYGIYFMVDGPNASVIAILHAKRDPSAWRDRT